MKWLIKGYINIAITGEQGCGKTTWLKALVRFIPEDLTIRVQELAFETNLRYTYPSRNVIAFQETDSVSSQDGLDVQKKTNGCVNILGEVATAEAASWVVQTSMVASLFSLFTHHAKTTPDLVLALRNNLMDAHAGSGFSNEKAAEELVAKVININCHQKKLGNHRFTEMIDEIVPIRDRRYPSERNSSLDDQTKMLKDTVEYTHRVTDRANFEVRTLVRFDAQRGRYMMCSLPTQETMDRIRGNLNRNEREMFEHDMEMLGSYIGKR